MTPLGLGASRSVVVDFDATWEITTRTARIHSLDVVCVDPAHPIYDLADPPRPRRQRLIGLFDRAVATETFRDARSLSIPCRISLRAHAETIAIDREYVGLALQTAASLRETGKSLIVHIIGEAPGTLSPLFLQHVRKLRAAGVAIGLTDVGTADSTYKLVMQLRPDYVCISDYFVRECHRDLTRRIVLCSIASLADRFGTRAIAGGISTMDELRAVVGNGITLIHAPALFGRFPGTLVAGQIRRRSSRVRDRGETRDDAPLLYT